RLRCGSARRTPHAQAWTPAPRAGAGAARMARSALMQGHIHKRVRTDKSGKERTLWYVVVDVGIDHNGRRRQKWHGGFRTRREALSAETISYIHAIVHKTLSDAIDADLVARNAADRAKPPRPNRHADRGPQAWDADELAAFLEEVSGSRLSAIWRLAAMTGM